MGKTKALIRVLPKLKYWSCAETHTSESEKLQCLMSEQDCLLQRWVIYLRRSRYKPSLGPAPRRQNYRKMLDLKAPEVWTQQTSICYVCRSSSSSRSSSNQLACAGERWCCLACRGSWVEMDSLKVKSVGYYKRLVCEFTVIRQPHKLQCWTALLAHCRKKCRRSLTSSSSSSRACFWPERSRFYEILGVSGSTMSPFQSWVSASQLPGYVSHVWLQKKIVLICRKKRSEISNLRRESWCRLANVGCNFLTQRISHHRKIRIATKI